MTGLIVCFAILCLSLTSGAPNPKNIHSFYSSAIKLDSGQFFLAINSIISHKDELVYAVCKTKHDCTIEHECKIYVKYTENVCDIKLNYTDLVNSYTEDVKLFNGGNSKAVFVVREDATKIRLNSINLEDCQVSEAIVEVPQLGKFDSLLNEIFILPNEKSYDVVYVNQKICGDFVCKATYDYEGNVVKAASVFSLSKSFIGRYQFEHVNGTIFAHSADDYLWGSASVYLVHDEDKEPQKLVNVTNSRLVGFSADENKISYCLRDQVIRCTKYDIKGKTKIMDFNIAIDNRVILSVFPYSLEKGMLVAIAVYNDNREFIRHPVSIVHFDESGKQGKSVAIDSTCGLYWPSIMKFYHNSNGEYCFFKFCHDRSDTGAIELHIKDICIAESEFF